MQDTHVIEAEPNAQNVPGLQVHNPEHALELRPATDPKLPAGHGESTPPTQNEPGAQTTQSPAPAPGVPTSQYRPGAHIAHITGTESPPLQPYPTAQGTQRCAADATGQAEPDAHAHGAGLAVPPAQYEPAVHGSPEMLALFTAQYRPGAHVQLTGGNPPPPQARPTGHGAQSVATDDPTAQYQPWAQAQTTATAPGPPAHAYPIGQGPQLPPGSTNEPAGHAAHTAGRAYRSKTSVPELSLNDAFVRGSYHVVVSCRHAASRPAVPAAASHNSNMCTNTHTHTHARTHTHTHTRT